MKKYHIADILTLCEVICTCILGVFILTDVAPEVALIIFGIGELCDAFDGICARKWKYPPDGKYRWWREYAPEIDKVTDVLHLIVMTVFFIFRICAKFTYFRPWVALSVAFVIALICITVQVVITDPKYKGTPYARRLIIKRRYLYLACIALVVFVGLYAVDWPLVVKTPLAVALCIGGIWLFILKKDRRTDP